MNNHKLMFQDYRYPLEERLNNLVDQLTIDEKISLLSTSQSAIPRLGIKEYQVGGEAAHGVVDRDGGKTTIFPQPIGLSSTWNRKLLRKIGDVIGDEARIFYEQHDQKTGLTLWAPTIDMERDPRWGRTEEAYGEDPYLTGQLSAELIKGMQGEDPFYIKLVAAPKHFYGNNNEYGRERISNSIDPRNRHEYYLRAFEPAFVEANALSMMTAYNGINGIPAMQIKEIKDIVKGEWQMDGFIVCDGGALSLNVDRYQYYDTYTEALADALKKGIDCFVDDKALVENAAYEALENGYIKEEDITTAIRNILKVRFRLGHFDKDQRNNPYAKVDQEKMCSDDHAELALEATKESIVLLKNEQQMLPLQEDSIDKVAVIGPIADVVYKDWYAGYAPYQITPLQGIRDRLKGKEVTFVKGNDVIALKSVEEQSYLSLGEDNQVAFSSKDIQENETFEIENWGWNSHLLKNTKNERYLCLNDDTQSFEASSEEIYSWFVKEKVSFHPIDEMRQKYHMSTWEDEPIGISKNNELIASQKPSEFETRILSSGNDEAVKAAKNSDVAIVCVGNHPMINGRETEDRPDLVLPEHQQKLIEEVYRVNQNMVVVIIGSYPFAINWVDEHVPAILYTSHGSQVLGEGIASILFGDESPSGKLSMTWYKDVKDLPSIFDYDIIKGKRTYMYFDKDVLYPFGYGLSYAAFKYHSLTVDKQTIDDESFHVHVEIENMSDIEASEVIQLYATIKDSVYVRPKKQLIDFAKVTFQPNERKVISLEVNPKHLHVWDVGKERFVLEKGSCLLSVGSSSEDIRLTEEVLVNGEEITSRSLKKTTNAENYNDYHDIYLDKGENNLNCVRNRSFGWISFERVEIDQEDNCLELRVKTDGTPGKITLKLNDLATKAVSEEVFEVEYPDQWKTIQIPFKAEKGVHDLYILMEGSVSINTIQLHS